MKNLRRLIGFCLGISLLCFALPAQAKHKKKSAASPPADLAAPPSEPGALGAESAPHVNPADPPSTSLQPFMDRRLGAILAPLGTSAFAQPEILASLKAGYADGMAAASASHKPAFAVAMSVCDAMTGAITERQNAAAALHGALATRSSQANQPRGGGEAVNAARETDAFFVDSQKNNWTQRATLLRQNIIALGMRERDVERQIGVWAPPPPPPPVAAATPVAAAPAPVMATAPTPSVSAPPAATPSVSAPATDPVVGEWLWGGDSPRKLTAGADGKITGERHGQWNFTTATNGGRNYEFHWAHKGWVDYMFLSADGRSLDGHTQEQKSISASRR